MDMLTGPIDRVVMGRREVFDAKRCIMAYYNECAGDGTAREWRDALSEREYAQSIMCQPCQDAVFETSGEGRE